MTEDAVALLAYLLWRKAGEPPNRDLEFWLEAEKQILKTPEVHLRDEPQWKLMIEAIKHCIKSHGPITNNFVGSCAKRIFFALNCHRTQFKTDKKFLLSFKQMIHDSKVDRMKHLGTGLDFYVKQQSYNAIVKLKNENDFLKALIAKKDEMFQKLYDKCQELLQQKKEILQENEELNQEIDILSKCLEKIA